MECTLHFASVYNEPTLFTTRKGEFVAERALKNALYISLSLSPLQSFQFEKRQIRQYHRFGTLYFYRPFFASIQPRAIDSWTSD